MSDSNWWQACRYDWETIPPQFDAQPGEFHTTTVKGPHGERFTLPNRIGLTVYGERSIEPNVEFELSDGYGTLVAREYGTRGNKFATCLHSVHSDGSEWEPIAKKLVDKGWYVLIPNWSANSKADPVNSYEEHGEYPRWEKYPQAYGSDLNDILKQTGYEKFDALLGFSWGGWLAGQRAAKFPDTVKKLSLVAPAFLFPDQVNTSNTLFAGYAPLKFSGSELIKMDDPTHHLDAQCANAFGIQTRAALSTEIIEGKLPALAKTPATPPTAWGNGSAAVVACELPESCMGDGTWLQSINSKNEQWPSKSDELSPCDHGCNQIICTTKAPFVSKAHVALFWGKHDQCVPYESSSWIKKIFKHLDSFTVGDGLHLIDPAWEDKIVSYIADKDDLHAVPVRRLHR